MNPDTFRDLGHRMVDFIASYMEDVESAPVSPATAPGGVLDRLPDEPPREGEPWDAIFEDLESLILPNLMHWQSPSFFGYFPCNASGPGILGEMLSAGLGVQGMLWSTSPACTELEIRMLDWMADAIGLPEVFTSRSPNGGGVIQGTASEASLVALVAAKRRHPGSTPVVYASVDAHSSIAKAASIAGVTEVRLVATDDDQRMNPTDLARLMDADRRAGCTPCFVCATVGTTSCTAIDPLASIGPLCAEVWLHVDAAHAGAACICPEYRWMLEGVEHADSICFNPHKWLLTNFDCNCFWTRDRDGLVESLSVTPEYLRNAASEAGAVIDYRDWQVPLGRRFRSLKLWFVMRHYGIEGLQAYIRAHCDLASRFESWVRDDDRFEIAAPTTCNLVCFRLKSGDTKDLLERVNATRRVFLSHTVIDGAYTMRMAIGARTTTESHVRACWDLIREQVHDQVRGP